MIVLGKDHHNILPAIFEDLGDGEIYVNCKSICGKEFHVPVKEFVEVFYLHKGDPEEIALWVSNGGKIAVFK